MRYRPLIAALYLKFQGGAGVWAPASAYSRIARPQATVDAARAHLRGAAPEWRRGA
jgi:hypothetical protein